jgi:hypothetical protein
MKAATELHQIKSWAPIAFEQSKVGDFGFIIDRNAGKAQDGTTLFEVLYFESYSKTWKPGPISSLTKTFDIVKVSNLRNTLFDNKYIFDAIFNGEFK